MVKFKVLKKNNDCYLLKYEGEEKYMVRDTENEVISITYNYDNALSVFEKYSLEEVRRIRRELFTKWLNEFTGE